MPVLPSDSAGTHSHFTHDQAQPHQSTALLRMRTDAPTEFRHTLSDTHFCKCWLPCPKQQAKMKEAGDIGLAELKCALDLYEYHGVL